MEEEEEVFSNVKRCVDCSVMQPFADAVLRWALRVALRVGLRVGSWSAGL